MSNENLKGKRKEEIVVRSRSKRRETEFGVSFFTSCQRHDSCGTNGLPLTPNSIRILGRSQYLKTLSHQFLAEYIDIIRGKHERIIFISEYYGNNLKKCLKNREAVSNTDKILKIANQILQALVYLNRKGITNGNLSLDNILLDEESNVKLFNYGLNYMTNYGRYVSFPVGTPKYTSPEILLSGMRKGPKFPSSDLWSLGIILLELILGIEIWSEIKLPEILERIQNCVKNGQKDNFEILFQIENETSKTLLSNLDPKLKSLINKCLEIDSLKRPNAEELLKTTEIFPATCQNQNQNRNNLVDIFEISQNYGFTVHKFLRSVNLKLDKINTLIGDENLSNGERDVSLNGEFVIEEVDHLSQRSLKEVYFLWQLAGGDVFAELKRQGLTRKKPAILALPNLMTLEGESLGKRKERGLLLDETVIILPLSELRKRLSDILPESYYPLLESISIISQIGNSNKIVKEASTLPLIIREKDIVYQFHRIILFDRLLKGYPYTKNAIYKESLLDIPPYFRAQIWSCLLDIQGDIELLFSSIDKETSTSTDRQIEVDIPRCHQYDELLSSTVGHEKFKRVLKAWVVSNKEYVYWQGLDSLSAPFLYLNFNNEAMAFSCLSSFIPKYLYNFFLKDNSIIIQEYLAKFSQLIAFHDPVLTNHLDSIGFIPELYAIPWFLTMFSHVFPLHKIFHLWDKLLLGDSSFSLCIGLAILYQLRESLLDSGFNECILLFSDMPEINIEQCVKDSVEIYCTTPKSALRRKQEPPVKKNESRNHIGSEDGVKSNYLRYEDNEYLQMEAISLSELKNERCPRISGEDFLQLLDLNRTKYKKPKMIVVDIRNQDEFNRGSIPGSLNIPFSIFNSQDKTLANCTEINNLNIYRGKIICVAGNRTDSAIKSAEAVLRLGFPKICVLHPGIDIFRSFNLLVVPTN